MNKTRDKYVKSAQNLSRRLSQAVHPQQLESDKKLDEASQVAERVSSFDPNSKRIQNYNDELKLHVDQDCSEHQI